MRSVTFTFFLLLLAAAVVVVAALQVKEGGLTRLFGLPVAEPGQRLYHFDEQKVRRIQLGGNGFVTECTFDKGVWTAECRRVNRQMKATDGRIPGDVLWKDRMDKRIADQIVQFTLGTQVEDVIPKGRLDAKKAGLREGTIGVNILDGDGNQLANYQLGNVTKWVHYDPLDPTKEAVPTVFIQPLDPGRGDEQYLGTGNIHPLFLDGFRHLRDHHPFYINPAKLESVRIKEGEVELLLTHAAPTLEAPWRIKQPVELKTDKDAVSKLVMDLFNLRAVQVKDRSEVTFPAESGNGKRVFTLRHFGIPTDIVLTIMPPATPDAETVYATVADRPGTVFELRLKPMPAVPAAPATPGLPTTPGVPPTKPAPKDDMVSLADLPDTIDELRDRMLTMLNGASLQGIRITPSTGPEVYVLREKPGAEWKYIAGPGKPQTANPITLLALHTLLTQTKVVGFETDSASDLRRYGLDLPAISLRFVSFGTDSFELAFGQGKDGTWYALRAGTTTVMRVDEELIRHLPTRLWQWRPPSVWSIADVDLEKGGIERTMTGKPTLHAEYNALQLRWHDVREDGKDRSAELVTARADRLREALLGLQAEEWVGPDDSAALSALASPTLRFEVVSMDHDEDSRLEKGLHQQVLILAPVTPGPNPKYYYGRVGNDNPFKILAKTVERLQVDLFGDD